MIFSLSLIALTFAVWLYAFIRFTRAEGRHAGSWRPLPHRSGSLVPREPYAQARMLTTYPTPAEVAS